MMNNSFNPTSLQQQHNVVTTHAQQPQQHASIATTANLPTTAASINYLQQPTQMQQHHQLNPLNVHQQQLAAAMGGTPAGLFDASQLQPANVLEKSYYPGAATLPPSNTVATTAATASARYFTAGSTASVQAQPPHPNTILITNNFAQQQLPAAQPQQRSNTLTGVPSPASFNSNSIRIVSTTPNTHQQHVYSISNNLGKDPATELSTAAHQQLYQQQLLQQQQQHFTHNQHLSTLLPQHFTQQHFAAQQPQQHHNQHQHSLQLQLPSTPGQQFYVATDATAVASTTAKLMPTMTSSVASAVGSASVVTAPIQTPTPNSASSTVVLDRINICINNHYSDATPPGTTRIDSPITLSTSLSATPAQQPSPIIPAIQHKAVVDSGSSLLIDPYASNESTLVIDEPDSTTTTPHTPPTTPENTSPASSQAANTAASTTEQSPSTTGASLKKVSFADLKQQFAEAANIIEKAAAAAAAATTANVGANTAYDDTDDVEIVEVTVMPQPQATQPQLSAVPPQTPATLPMTPPTPPTPPPPTVTFNIGEDVFIKRQDGRFYLGTIINCARQQFLVSFDDKSELWCTVDEMRKFGAGSSKGDSSGDSSAKQVQMCVACKRSQNDDTVEICERCGRGYHRNCTTETSYGSGDWLCKRCCKPMKVLITNNNNNREGVKKFQICRQLPYRAAELNWDEKHRVNDEQIYCYCGKTGKFDHNMLQCCKCSNWFHTHCMQCFKSTILRGDGFFVFCCSLCHNGEEEFLRRLQMNWVDLMHLTLYNLSAMKKHQHQKYHHFVNDIWPFVKEKRATFPIPQEWIDMPEAQFKEQLKSTLNLTTDRFMCGREFKRDHDYFALRTNGPPLLPKFHVQLGDVLCDKLVTQSLNLTLLKGAPENESKAISADLNDSLTNSKRLDVAEIKDVYEFRIEDDEKFTSDDEIPIKLILNKAKKIKTSPTTDKTVLKSSLKKSPTTLHKKIEMDDENANDAANASLRLTKKSPQKNDSPKGELSLSPAKATNDKVDHPINPEENVPSVEAVAAIPTVRVKNSRKRKAFTLSKSYKEVAAEGATATNRICDSSSDENSSSSRCTSLDLIIPPPKNFLGPNNPFRMVTPKKSTTSVGSGGGGKKSVSFARGSSMIKNSIFNTTTLDFSSKLAALKSAGMFPNFSTSNLAKAAGQPRTVRTIKRRLSAKDITIGPNQEVRRRRTRRLSSNIEVISTTTINPIPSNFFPIHAKDLLSSTTHTTTINHKQIHHQQQHINQIASSSSSSPPTSTTSSMDSLPLSVQKAALLAQQQQQPAKPTHGRRLRQRPPPLKSSTNDSRRSSISGASTSSNQSNSSCLVPSGVAATSSTGSSDSTTMQDLKQSVNKYFGAANRIESGEQFSIRAKRQLSNGQMQYLIEWGDATITSTTTIC